MKLDQGEYILDSVFHANRFKPEKYHTISELAELVDSRQPFYVFLDREYGEALYDITLPDSSLSLKALQEWL